MDTSHTFPSPSPTSPALVLHEVKKKFSNNVVLDGVTVSIPRGELFCILGKSGTGKSVLLKCIMNILNADSGDIWYGEYNLARMTTKNRFALKDFGYLFQDAALFDFMNVEENIAFPLHEVLKIKNNHLIREKVAELLKLVELPDIEKRMPSELSGGMRKRVGLARTLAMNPKIMLCDEPTTGLDPGTGSSIMELIQRTSKALGVTCIIITHDLPTSFRISDHFAFLDRGKIRAVGTKDNFMENPYQLLQEFISYSFVNKTQVLKQ